MIYILCFNSKFLIQSRTRFFWAWLTRYLSVADSIAPCCLYSLSPMLYRPWSTLKRKYRFSSKCFLHLAMNRFSVSSVSVVIPTTVWPRNLKILSSNTLIPGFPVPIKRKHLTRGFRSPDSEHQMFTASPSTSSTRLFAPSPPSANIRFPI